MKTLPGYRAVCVLFLALCCLLLGRSTHGQVNVTTYHNGNARTGVNASETILTPAQVQAPGQFGKVFSQPVDGYVYAQPLYVSGVNIAGKGTHNVVFVATEGDSVYAFDADNSAGTNASPLWQASLIDNDHGVPMGVTATTVSSSDVNCTDLVPQIGITGTPVIDVSAHTMYVEAKSKENGNFVHRLHALDITSGAEIASVVITASVPGITFDSLTQLNRPGLLLLNHTIYIGYGSHCDGPPYSGWLLSFDAVTLAPKDTFIATPAHSNGQGAIWMSGAGIAGDDVTYNIFVATGNGQFDATDFGDSIVKLSSNLGLLDSFTPFNEPDRNVGDLDLGSGGVLLLPQQPGNHPHLLVQAGKGGSAGGRGPFGAIYLVDEDQMTVNNQHFCMTCTDDAGVIVQELPSAVGGMWSMPAYWNNAVYFWGTGDNLKAFSLTNGLLGGMPTSISQELYDFPGANMSLSANGNTNGVVWSLGRKKIGQNSDGSVWQTVDVLQAHDAGDVSHTLYSSDADPSHKDDLGTYVKFSVPTVATGRVYVGGVGQLTVYGLPYNYVGFLDHAGCDSIFGWAADRNGLNASITVTIYDNGVAVQTVLANSLRSDVGASLGDNGLHGFGITTPMQMRDGATHQVSVKFANGVELGTSPKSLMCPASALTLRTSGNSVYGQNVVFTAQVSGIGSSAVPTGAITFKDGNQVLGIVQLDSSAQAFLSTTFLSAGRHVITALYSGDSVFPANSVEVAQVVAPAQLSVSVNSATRVYGDPNPAFTGTISGLQNNDNITPNFTTSATTGSNVGTYPISPGLGDLNGRLPNYTVSSTPGVLTITPAPLQVIPNNKTRMYLDPNPQLDGTISGIRNNDNITPIYSTPATPQSLVGTYPINATLLDPDNRLGNYTPDIEPGPLTVTRSNIPLAVPTFNPPQGVYPAGQAITISDATSNTAAIHYTTDGSTPWTGSPLYTGPIILNAPVTLVAIAMQPEYLDSGLAIASYNQIPISVTPHTQEASGCTPVNYTVTVPAMNNLSGSLALSISGLPRGATATFSPASIGSPGSSTLTLTTSSTPKGTFPLMITVTNGTVTGTASATLKNKSQQPCP